MAKPRTPGPVEVIARKDGTPSPTMLAWMRRQAEAEVATADYLAALVAALIDSGALPEGWEP
ncbi:hypothetical protein [Amaricoccus solimangrovi]|uniref:Uncharacterized protein n=1 Tax=Amaricoccus solimangrovi TaxID=2589815 RepID=A0A501X132_9RHOB|nr:hypothetical protein [Amaricoccus solimangrovi]TPE53076.1 hypothetical protein FJM51_03365 [Amaricoccus solimangrovi]